MIATDFDFEIPEDLEDLELDDFQDNLEVLEALDEGRLEDILYGDTRERNAFGYSEDIDWSAISWD